MFHYGVAPETSHRPVEPNSIGVGARTLASFPATACSSFTLLLLLQPFLMSRCSAATNYTPSRKGIRLTDNQKRKISIANKGKVRTPEQRLKYSVCKRGEKSPSWKGNQVKYSALHSWVRKILGTPRYCSNCHSFLGIGKQTWWWDLSSSFDITILFVQF